MTLWQLTSARGEPGPRPGVALVGYRLMTAAHGRSVHLVPLLHPCLSGEGSLSRPHRCVLGGLCSARRDQPYRAGYPGCDPEPPGLYLPIFGPLVPVVALIAWAALGYAMYCLIEGYQATRYDVQRNVSAISLWVRGVRRRRCEQPLPAASGVPVDVAANVVAPWSSRTPSCGTNSSISASSSGRAALLGTDGHDRRQLLSRGLYSGHHFHLVTEYEILMVSLLVAAIKPLPFSPARPCAITSIDRLFFRERYDSRCCSASVALRPRFWTWIG